MNKDSTHTIFHSALRFFSGTMLSRISGLLRDVIMAFAFGTQNSVAALLVSFRWSHLLRRLLGEGALQTAFIPHFEKLKGDDPNRAYQFFKDLTYTLTIVLVSIILLTMGSLWGILEYAVLSADNREILYLTFLMMPGLLFICLYGLNASLLQCEKYYFTPSAAPIAFNLVWILGVLFIWNKIPSEGMNWLAVFIVIACFFEWAITIPKTWQILKANGSSTTSWVNLTPLSKDVINLSKPLFLGMIGIGATQINNALDTVFARYADIQGPAFLWYAIRLQQLPLALFGIALSGAILPPLVRALKKKEHEVFFGFLEYGIRRSLAFMLPIMFGLIILGGSCINLVYGRGDFNDQSIIGTTECLWAYSLGLIPMTLVLIMAPGYYALGDYKTTTRASVIAMVVNISLNAILIFIFGLGAASVALATSVSAWINLGILATGLSKQNDTFKKMQNSIYKILLSSLIGFFGVIIFDSAFYQESSFLKILTGDSPHFPKFFIDQIVHFFSQSSIFIVFTLASAWWLEAEDLLNLVFLNKRSKAAN